MTIAIVGEAWGRQEEEAGASFAGSSGRILNSLLHQVGISRDECLVTSVFNFRPQPTNEVINLCGPRAEGIPGFPSLIKAKYVRAEYGSELTRLYSELETFRPNVVVAMGATAAWALLHTSGIKNVRGAPAVAHVAGLKVLPTYHPNAIIRDWRLRPIVLMDLDKAKRESAFPEVRRPEREIWVEPTVEDLWNFKREFLDPADYISEDIETKGRTITCVGFAPSIDRALVLPFFNPLQPDGNYWRTLEEEREAWNFVRTVNQMPKMFVGQNFLYDMHFQWKEMGIPVPGATHDTMLLHHALQPELEKGLGFLGSIYTDEAQWKMMRKGSGTVKRED